MVTVFSSQVAANGRHYSVSVEQSEWLLKESTKLHCAIEHSIPGYGVISFTSSASKRQNLRFELGMLRQPTDYGMATIYSVPPTWMPGVSAKTIGKMPLLKQFDPEVADDYAWIMLSELEKGLWPTIRYQDWNNQHDVVSVGLNASRFKPAYQDFIYCIDSLLPFSFEDIAFSVLSYEKNSVNLTRQSERMLNMIGQYLKADPSIEAIMLDGYSDSYGPRSTNQRLSEKRALAIQSYLVSVGVESGKIVVTGHGERRHIAPNDNAVDRARNRRVVIKMQKNYLKT
jgi:outer membrane protein OmpA-like peptidoglycan-associated protein